LLLLLLLRLALALEPQHEELHEQAQRFVHLGGGLVGQLLEGVFQKLGQFPQEQEDSHVDLLQHLQNVLNSLLLIFFKSYVVLLIVNMLQQQ
jgi:ammonia channel protein AmtB